MGNHMNYKQEYSRWLRHADAETVKELKTIEQEEEQIKESFSTNLSFGTAGLRGIVGAGTNRMNIYTVARASQGLANYINRRYFDGSIAISYDTRIMSEEFAKTAAGIFAANGIKVFQYREQMPTPCLSYAVRRLNCSAGVMITASHNPAQYNGYKVYDSDGCQITDEAAKEISDEIEKVDAFTDVHAVLFDEGGEKGNISYIHESVFTDFTEEIKGRSVLYGEKEDKNVAVVYTPLNGTGLKPVLRVLKEGGFTNVTIVQEQAEPDGSFRTCPYPNPESKEAMKLGLSYAQKCHADLILATDPDCDRIGIAVKCGQEFKLLTGNEVGLLLLEYICEQRTKHCKMPKNPIMIKSIVTTDLAEKLAESYGVKTINVLTGFKYIGELIGTLEREGKADSYIFGYEESCGYLSGAYVRDKDAVNAAYMICEMFSYYKTMGIGLMEKLQEIYRIYGYCLNTVHSFVFEGIAGFEKMQWIMKSFRNFEARSIGGLKIQDSVDYLRGIDGLPKSDVIKFNLASDCSIIVRPSGTEPKLKIYISVRADNKETAVSIEKQIMKELESLIK